MPDAAHQHDFFDCDREVPVHSFQLGHVGRAQWRRFAVADLTNRWLQDSQDKLQQAGLASPTRPDDSCKLAAVQVQVDIIKHIL